MVTLHFQCMDESSVKSVRQLLKWVSGDFFQLQFSFHLTDFLTCFGHFIVDVSLRSCLLPSIALQRARHRSFRHLSPWSIQDKQSASSSGPTPGPLNKAIYHAVWPDLFGHSQGCLSLRAPALSTIPPLCPCRPPCRPLLTPHDIDTGLSQAPEESQHLWWADKGTASCSASHLKMKHRCWFLKYTVSLCHSTSEGMNLK